MLLSLYRYLSGYLAVRVSGARPEGLVNRLVDAGVDLWDLRRQGDALTGCIRLADFRAIRPLVRAAGCRVRIRRRGGLPFLLRRLRARHMLLAGALFCGLTLLWFTSHYWVVEVQGAERVDARAVRAGVASLGLRPGVLRWRVDLRRLEAELPRLVPDLAVVAVRTRGTRAVVAVVERVVPRPLPLRGRVDLVADRAGCLVESVVAFWGLARVKAGQPVAPGQTLIEGVFYQYSSPPLRTPWTDMAAWPPPPDVPVAVGMAQGEVWARCFRQEYVEVPLFRTEEVPTGRRATRVVLRLGKKEILIRGGAQPPFAAARVEHRTARLPGWRNWLPPVEVTTEVHSEVTRRQVPLAPAAAREEAARAQLERLAWHLTPGVDQVVAQDVVEWLRTPAYLGLRLTVETRERIGRPLPVAAGLPAPPPRTGVP